MTFEKVQKILAEQLELDADEITMDSSLVEDLGIDSLDFVDIVMSLEDEFDTEFPEEDMAGIKTVGDIVKYIEDKISKHYRHRGVPVHWTGASFLCPLGWDCAICQGNSPWIDASSKAVSCPWKTLAPHRQNTV